MIRLYLDFCIVVDNRRRFQANCRTEQYEIYEEEKLDHSKVAVDLIYFMLSQESDDKLSVNCCCEGIDGGLLNGWFPLLESHLVTPT